MKLKIWGCFIAFQGFRVLMILHIVFRPRCRGPRFGCAWTSYSCTTAKRHTIGAPAIPLTVFGNWKTPCEPHRALQAHFLNHSFAAYFPLPACLILFRNPIKPPSIERTVFQKRPGRTTEEPSLENLNPLIETG